jgi:hypothetical protein
MVSSPVSKLVPASVIDGSVSKPPLRGNQVRHHAVCGDHTHDIAAFHGGFDQGVVNKSIPFSVAVLSSYSASNVKVKDLAVSEVGRTSRPVAADLRQSHRRLDVNDLQHGR